MPCLQLRVRTLQSSGPVHVDKIFNL